MPLQAGVCIYNTAQLIVEQQEFHPPCHIGDGCHLYLRKLVLKPRSHISAGTIALGMGDLELGEEAVVGFGCLLITGTDTPEARSMSDYGTPKDRKVVRGKIVLEDGAILGSGSIVSVGAKHRKIVIGQNTVVGAGTRLFKSLAPNLKVVPKQDLEVTPRWPPT